MDHSMVIAAQFVGGNTKPKTGKTAEDAYYEQMCFDHFSWLKIGLQSSLKIGEFFGRVITSTRNVAQQNA